LDGIIEDDRSIQGRVSLGKGSMIRKGALVRGPAAIGRNTVIESTVYLGPYTSIGSDCTIRRGEIENSIIMDGCEVDVDDRIVDSLIGANSKIASYGSNIPRGRSFILGDSSSILL